MPSPRTATTPAPTTSSGCSRSAFANYFQYIQLRLAHPDLVSRAGETWVEHLHRLQSDHTSVRSGELTCNVAATLVNAADYGVPQQRWRVFVVGFRSDLDAEWSFPSATHSHDALLYSQWVSGDYWDRHKVPKSKRDEMPTRAANRVRSLKETGKPSEKPWRTVRDAIGDLPEPKIGGHRKHLNHILQPRARAYPGHTGSPIDLPAKALKAGGHGVPGGENMLRRPDGSVRYFSIRESARLQTFPDRYELHGAWGEAMRQLGNAVPVLLAQKVAGSVAEHISIADFRAAAKERGNGATKRANA
ncbi:DNA cytosine methyltransferase [Rhodococcus sp. NPDC060176]|uniref:DNA cytosine methyltransferase n=1 Tax=Rhodococcus sp. NPDC060176 TaxID=3347062 RepID=UPI00365E07F0